LTARQPAAENVDRTALSPLLEALVLHFGEMGSRWGISRTFGQIYALLVFSEAPKCADEISEALGFSRSNVSMGLKELQSWGLVRLQHLPGDRKDYFSVPEDVWEIARTLLRERRRREIDPTLTVLRSAVADAADPAARPDDGYAVQRLREMLDFIELVVGWTEDMQRLSPEDLRRLMRMGAGVTRVLEFSRRAGRRRADDEAEEA